MAYKQVLDSSIELTEKQHSMGSAQHSPEEGAGRRQPSEAMGADEHEVRQVWRSCCAMCQLP